MTRVAAISALGITTLLAFWTGYDFLIGTPAEAVVGGNAASILIWLSFFATAVAGYFAIAWLRGSLHQDKSSPPLSCNDVAAAMVEQAAKWTPTERRALIASLSRIPDYEEADPLAASIEAH
jgi:hypothetical protein